MAAPGEPPAQTAPGEPGPPPNHRPMSRQDEHARIAALGIKPGLNIQITFRNSESDTTLASDWDQWTGEVIDRVLLADGVQAWRVEYPRPDGVFLGYLPVGVGYDVSTIDILKKQAGRATMTSTVGSKRDRDDNKKDEGTKVEPARTDPTQPTGFAIHDVAKALVDARLSKNTNLVSRGDGLKIPASIPSEFRCCYPNVYWERREKGESAEKLAEDIRSDWDAMKDYLGATLKGELRSAFRQGVDHAANAILPASPPPSKSKWRSLFADAFATLATLVASSTNSFRAGERLKSILFKQFDEKNLVDVEEALRIVEGEGGQGEHKDAPPQQAPAATAPTAREIASMVQAEVAKLLQDTKTARGGGGNFRGNFRGGRGRGGN